MRDVSPEAIGGMVDLIVGDLSFISLTKVVEPLLKTVVTGGDLVLLVKPQFEAGRADVSKGRGVITDPDIWRRAVDDVVAAFADRGAVKMGEMESPIHGAEGNTEFLVHLRKTTATLDAGRQVDS